MRKYIASFLFTLLSLVAIAQTVPSFNAIRFVGSDSTSGAVTVNGTLRVNPVTGELRLRRGGSWTRIGGSGGGGSSTFVGLTDGPGSFSGHGLDYTRVNSGATALEYRTPSQVRSDIGAQATITFGTGVQTALGVNIGSAGAPLLFNGAGGTPSSMTGTNITGIVGSNVTNTPAGNIVATTSQAAINELDGEKLAIVNSAASITDASTMDITSRKHTLTTSSATRTFTISYTGDDVTMEITLNATASTFTFPATTLCVSDGVESGDNNMYLNGVSGDKYIIAIKKIGSNYYAVAKNFGQ